MVESTSAWRTHKGAWVCAATSVCFGRVMDSTSAARWEQQYCAPVRARSTEDGGGAAGPSTVKGKTKMVKFFKEMKCFSLPPHAGPGDAPKGASPGLCGGAESFFSVVLCWQNVKICECLLVTPVFNASGLAVCRPQSVAGR